MVIVSWIHLSSHNADEPKRIIVCGDAPHDSQPTVSHDTRKDGANDFGVDEADDSISDSISDSWWTRWTSECVGSCVLAFFAFRTASPRTMHSSLSHTNATLCRHIWSTSQPKHFNRIISSGWICSRLNEFKMFGLLWSVSDGPVEWKTNGHFASNGASRLGFCNTSHWRWVRLAQMQHTRKSLISHFQPIHLHDYSRICLYTIDLLCWCVLYC